LHISLYKAYGDHHGNGSASAMGYDVVCVSGVAIIVAENGLRWFCGARITTEDGYFVLNEASDSSRKGIPLLELAVELGKCSAIATRLSAVIL